MAVPEDLEVKGLTQSNKPETKRQHRQHQTPSPQHRAENRLGVEDITRKKEIQEIVPRIKTEVPVILDDIITQPEVSNEMVETEDYPSSHDEYGGYDQNYQEADMIYQEEEVEMMNTTTGISEPRLIVTNVEF